MPYKNEQQRKEYQEKYRINHREDAKKYGRKWRLEHKEYCQNYEIEHKEERKAKNVAYRSTHPEEIKIREVAYRATRTDYIRERARNYYHEHKEAGKENRRKYNIEHRDTFIERRLSMRKNVIEHYGGKCAFCGDSNLNHLCIDHINGDGNKHRKSIKSPIYQWLLKNNYPEGFQVLCHTHNMEKAFYGTMTPICSADV